MGNGVLRQFIDPTRTDLPVRGAKFLGVGVYLMVIFGSWPQANGSLKLCTHLLLSHG